MRPEVEQRCGVGVGRLLQGLIKESKDEDWAWGRGVGEGACSGNSGSCASSGWVEVVGGEQEDCSHSYGWGAWTAKGAASGVPGLIIRLFVTRKADKWMENSISYLQSSSG